MLSPLSLSFRFVVVFVLFSFVSFRAVFVSFGLPFVFSLSFALPFGLVLFFTRLDSTDSTGLSFDVM